MTSSCVTWYCFKGALFKAVCLPNQKFDWGETLCVLVKDFNLLKLTSCMTLPCLFVFLQFFFNFDHLLHVLTCLRTKQGAVFVFYTRLLLPETEHLEFVLKQTLYLKSFQTIFFIKASLSWAIDLNQMSAGTHITTYSWG